MNKICIDYCKLIKNKYSNFVNSIVIYGSNIYNESSSDLDVCLIVKEHLEDIEKEIIEDTLNFHSENNLVIDEEIPHNNKLIYSWQEIKEAIEKSPFYVDGEVKITDIKKTQEYLSSKEMKQRLILNILTTDHLTIGKSTEIYEKLAFKLIIKTIVEYFELSNPNDLEILDCMYKNKFTGAEGEMYLGYKRNYKKERYLLKKIKENIKDD